MVEFTEKRGSNMKEISYEQKLHELEECLLFLEQEFIKTNKRVYALERYIGLDALKEFYRQEYEKNIVETRAKKSIHWRNKGKKESNI